MKNIYSRYEPINMEFVESIIQEAITKSHVVIDGFCGMGGVTEGFDDVPDYMVIACINHWDKAIRVHAADFPLCLHMIEDFRVADLKILQYMVSEIRRRKPSIVFHLWLSLECTNFSNAKGGLSRDADSRSLADDAPRYLIELNPDVIWVENVKEFKLWGPMIPKVQALKGEKKKIIYTVAGEDEMDLYKSYVDLNVPVFCPLVINKEEGSVGPWKIPHPIRKGEDYRRWKKDMCSYGYHVEDRLMNCADYGVPQHRIRLIMQFARKGCRIEYPSPTHSKTGRGLPKWLAVAPCLDLDDEGESVLSFAVSKSGVLRPRIKSPKTIERLIKGCQRHVLKSRKNTPFYKPSNTSVNPESFLVNYNHSSDSNGVDSESPAIVGSDKIGLAKAHMLDYYFGNNNITKPIDEPANVSGTKDGASLQTVKFIAQAYSGNDTSKVPPITNPSRAVTGTGGNMSVVTSHFIDQQYGNGINDRGLEETCGAVLENPKQALVSTKFMSHEFSSGQTDKDISDPSGALLNHPKQKLVDVQHFILDTQFNNGSKEITEPIGTQTANRKHYYLVNFQWSNSAWRDIERPGNTVIARMDKAPSYLITTEEGFMAIEIYPHDPPHYVRLKRFMAENGIVSINMRMLNERELLRIMSLRENRTLTKSSTDNKKLIGNAVPKKLVSRLAEHYHGMQRTLLPN